MHEADSHVRGIYDSLIPVLWILLSAIYSQLKFNKLIVISIKSGVDKPLSLLNSPRALQYPPNQCASYQLSVKSQEI